MREEGWHAACMEKSVLLVHALVSGIRPGDALEANLYQEWISNDRRIRALLAQIRKVDAKAAALLLKEPPHYSSKNSSADSGLSHFWCPPAR